MTQNPAQQPSFDDPTTFARSEALGHTMGAPMRPRVVLFHGDVPTIYMRSRLAAPRDGLAATLHTPLQEMLAVAQHTRPDRAVLVVQCPVNQRDDVRASKDPEARESLLVQRAWRVEGEVHTDTTMILMHCDDRGKRTFAAPERMSTGPFDALLVWALDPTDAQHGIADGIDLAGMVYALTRFGHIVAVRESWRDRLGFDAVPTPRLVRDVDRPRAERARRRKRSSARLAQPAKAAR